MITPNKFTKFDESIIGKMTKIIEVLSRHNNLTIKELYHLTEKTFSCIDEFIYAIDVLHILDTVEVDFINRGIKYVKRNKL